MRLAFIDHYDSFSFNVIDWIKSVDPLLELEHIYFDDEETMQDLARRPCPLVLSPGPTSPNELPSTRALVSALWDQVPMLGICLGHQLLGSMLGGEIRRHVAPHHGLARRISLTELGENAPLFNELPKQFTVGVYNSLSVAVPANGSPDFTILAQDEFGEVQALVSSPNDVPCKLGVQFHPESFLSEYAETLARNSLRLLRGD